MYSAETADDAETAADAETAEEANDSRAEMAGALCVLGVVPLGVLCGLVSPLCVLGVVSRRRASSMVRSPSRLRTSPRWRQACSTASRSALAPAKRRSKSGRDSV